jgi:DNA-binding MarR family transcriptional regulator
MSSVPNPAEEDDRDTSLKTDFEKSVAFHLTALANKLSIRASQRLRRRLDVGLMEWRLIALLGVEGGATPARVAQVAGVDKSVVSRAVGALQRRGLVSVCSDPPGRQTMVRLTDEGQKLHDRGMPGVLQAEDLLVHGFSPEERRLFLDLLRRMTANLTRLPP